VTKVEGPGELRGKAILVTGGSRGIGRTIALACAREGALVAVCGRSTRELEETAELLRQQSPFGSLTVEADVGNAADVGRCVELTQSELGPIYGLVCAAGVLGPIASFEETAFEDWERTIRINLVGSARCAHAVAAAMKRRGDGRIVFFSGGGQGPCPGRSAYAASKGAIWRLTESLGAELGPAGVQVNAIAPGAVNTRLLDDLLAAGPAAVGQAEYERALKRKADGGTPADKAGALCVFLLSSRSRGLYGKIISAVWDDYASWTDLDEMSRSDLYTVRRVTRSDGWTR
jgi:NAD(P)-dependent dehydrogenase (short-subunit alcohol dehydrogenase family)